MKASPRSAVTRRRPVEARAPSFGALSTAFAVMVAKGARAPDDGDHADLAANARFVTAAAFFRQAGRPSSAVRSSVGQDGKRTTHLAVVADDSPWLAQALADALADQALAVERMDLLVVSAGRDASGRLEAWSLDDDEPREAVFHVRIDCPDLRAVRAVVRDLEDLLDEARLIAAEHAGPLGEPEREAGEAGIAWEPVSWPRTASFDAP